jgi:hypothetical protein
VVTPTRDFTKDQMVNLASGQRRRGQWGARATDQQPDGDGVTAHHDVDVAALLETRTKDRVAGRRPGPLSEVW